MNRPRVSLLAAISLVGVAAILAWLRLSSSQDGALQGPVSQEWVATYNGPDDGVDSVEALVVDGQGNVYLAGNSEGVGTDDDYATIKYDSEGNEQWVARFSGPASTEDMPQAMVVDKEGNVYVSGIVNEGLPFGTSGDYGTVKYSADGKELWVALYDGAGHGYDKAEALALDGEGNSYVTGSAYEGTETEDDLVTIKYNSDGNQVWLARFNSPANGADRGYALAIDDAGSVYVTGNSYPHSDVPDFNLKGDIVTVKYGADGIEQWVRSYDGPRNGDDNADALAVDEAGNVYITGFVDSRGLGQRMDYVTIKYDTNGNEQWVAYYNGPQNGEDWPVDIAVDREENVYVTGRSDYLAGGTGPNYGTIKYDATGVLLWAAIYDGPGYEETFGFEYNYDDEPEDMFVDGEGNVYVTGRSRVQDTGDDWATIKYDPDGQQLWLARYDAPDHGSDWAEAVAVDNSGNVYVAGTTGPVDFTLVKYSQGSP